MKKFILVAGLVSCFALYGAGKEAETKEGAEKAVLFKLKNKSGEDIYYMHAQSLFRVGMQSEQLLKKGQTTTIMLTHLPKLDMYYILRLYPASAVKTETGEEQEALRTDYNIPQDILEVMADKTFEITSKNGRLIIPDLDHLLQKLNLTRTSLIEADIKKEMSPYKD